MSLIQGGHRKWHENRRLLPPRQSQSQTNEKDIRDAVLANITGEAMSMLSSSSTQMQSWQSTNRCSGTSTWINHWELCTFELQVHCIAPIMFYRAAGGIYALFAYHTVQKIATKTHIKPNNRFEHRRRKITGGQVYCCREMFNYVMNNISMLLPHIIKA